MSGSRLVRLVNYTLFVFLAAGAFFGCQKTPPPLVPVVGLITMNGKPLPRAEITFAPTVPGFGAEIMSRAISDDQGRFEMVCVDQPGACACEHKVTVTEGPMPDQFRGMSAKAQAGASQYLASMKNRPIPLTYGNFAQTPLTITVSADRQEYTLELKR